MEASLSLRKHAAVNAKIMVPTTKPPLPQLQYHGFYVCAAQNQISFGTNYSAGKALMEAGHFERARTQLEIALLGAENLQASLRSIDVDRISLFELQRDCYLCLQEILISLEEKELAIALSERSKARALSHIMKTGLNKILSKEDDFASNSESEGRDVVAWDDIKFMVRDEQVTLIEYSVLGRNRLAVWVISSSGIICECKIIEMHLSDLGSISVLLEVLRCAIGARGRGDIAQERADKFSVQPSGTSESPQQDVAGVSANPQEQEDALGTERAHVCDWLSHLAEHPVCGLKQAEALKSLKSQADSWHYLRMLTNDKLSDYCAAEPATSEWILSQINCLFEEERLLTRLYEILIAPVEDALRQAAAEELLIVPDLDLAMVPWAALHSLSGRHIVEDYTVRIAPSLTVSRQAVLADVSNSETAMQHKVVVVGNPWPTSYGNMFYPLPKTKPISLYVKT